jgi:hypothetical protein
VRCERAFPGQTPVRYAVYPWIATVTQGPIDSFEGGTLTHLAHDHQLRRDLAVAGGDQPAPHVVFVLDRRPEDDLEQ